MPERHDSGDRPRRAGLHPGRAWAWARRSTQLLALLAITVGPFLGGWQRIDRNRLASWDGLGWDLPGAMMKWLPAGEASAKAYEFNRMLGGGAGVDYLGVPVIDPVGGSLALAWTSSPSVRVIVAWLIPVVLGLLAGRIFCGWFCPFGTLARGLDIGLRHLAPRWPRFALPRRRWPRFVVLAGAVTLGALGSQTLLYLLLPHALVQQATYGLWLMGGGGAALGALAGLLLVGLVFGPTAYCATVCPTGASLALLGRARVVHLAVVDPPRCGKACDLCDRACWLDLRPSGGTAGPDCDLCARCTAVCPHDNLAVVLGKRPTTYGRGVHALGLALLVALAGGCGASERAWRHDPRLLLESRVDTGDAQLHVSVVELEGFRNDPDDLTPLEGSEVSVYLVRGPRGQPDEFGKLPARDVHMGPLELTVRDAHGVELASTRLEHPNYPSSVGRRTIYRLAVDQVLTPGATVEVSPSPGWMSEPAVVWVPPPNLGTPGVRVVGYLLASFGVFAGLVCLGLASANGPGLSPAPKPARPGEEIADDGAPRA